MQKKEMQAQRLLVAKRSRHDGRLGEEGAEKRAAMRERSEMGWTEIGIWSNTVKVNFR